MTKQQVAGIAILALNVLAAVAAAVLIQGKRRC